MGGYDVVVAGSGMSGTAAALAAAGRGARVLVLEKDARAGGNARWAGGFDLDAYDFDELRERNPEGDPALQRLAFDQFADIVGWLRGFGVVLEEVKPGRFGYMPYPHSGIGGLRAFEALGAALARAGVEVRTGVALAALRVERGRVAGVETSDGSVVPAEAAVLATGSFGRSAALKRRFLGANGAATGHYGTDGHDGDGILAALAVGAALGDGASVPTGGCVLPPPFRPPVGSPEIGTSGYASLEPLPTGIQRIHLRPPAWGESCVLANRDGARYVDETLPYSWVGLQTTRQPGGRALCVFDSRTYGLQGEEFDAMRTATLERAAAHGAVLLRHDRLDRLARLARGLGFEEGRLARTLREAGTELAEPPFYAMPVVQGVVDMAGGLEVDAELRLLDADRRPIPGLHAAGADAGRLYRFEHGGLTWAAVSGRAAGRSAAAG